MNMNTSKIKQMSVSSKCAYIVYGSVRGLVSQHRTLRAARAALARDAAGSARQGGYSDATVFVWASDRWQPLPA